MKTNMHKGSRAGSADNALRLIRAQSGDHVCAGMRKPAGKIIGAAEVNKELKDRNRGFGAYDIPFLGPTGDRTTKDASDEQVPVLARRAHPCRPSR